MLHVCNSQHLRMDIIRQQQKAEREEEERLKKEQEEKYRSEQEKKCPKVEEEEVIINTEYLVYICQCCDKMFKTTNAFKNHTESNKHKEKAKLYEEAGVIVTEVVLADELANVDCDYNDDDDDEELNVKDVSFPEEKVQDESDVEDTDEEEEYEFEEKKESAFSAFAAFSDSSSSSSSSSDEEDYDDDQDLVDVGTEDHKPSSTEEETAATAEEENDYYEDDLDLLEDIIYQNRLNEQLYPEDCEGGSDNKEKALALPPIAFDDDQYDPDKADRLEVVQHRLQKKLAAKGIEPSQIQPGYKCSDAVTIGKTLLQEVMAANVEGMQAKLALYKEHKREHQLLGREFKFAKGNSKALASQYSYRIDPSDNARTRANVHHTGSHYHMAAARSMYYGRSKGLMARHSSQGSRLQASRMAAKETATMHGKGGGKVGKISGKKSNMKRRGEAGGSKKCGGEGGD